MKQWTESAILITGGSKGIGRAIAEELARRGANLYLLARGQAALAETAEAIRTAYPKARVEVHPCDVSDYAQVAEAVAAMHNAFGKIDGVIANAGMAAPGYFDDIAPEAFEHAMRVNYLGTVYPIKAALPHLQRGAFIGITSSVAGYFGVFGYTSYAPTKFAQIGLAESLQQELTPRGIHVAILCPPDTQTPGLEAEGVTKPYETQYLSGTAKVMAANAVARRFINGLERGQFLINCNAESVFLYRLKGIAPNLTRRLINRWIRQAQGNTTSRSRR